MALTACLRILSAHGQVSPWVFMCQLPSVVVWGLLLGDSNSSALVTYHVHGHSELWWPEKLLLRAVSKSWQLEIRPVTHPSGRTVNMWSKSDQSQHLLLLTVIGPEVSMWSRLGQSESFPEFFLLGSFGVKEPGGHEFKWVWTYHVKKIFLHCERIRKEAEEIGKSLSE